MAFEPFMQLIRSVQKRRIGVGGSVQNTQQMAYLRHLQKEMNKENAMLVPLQELDVVVFDIETTGFIPEKDSILSIGAIKMKGSKIIEEEQFYSLIFYDQNIPKDIVELTGISDELVRSAPSIGDVLIKFFEFSQDATFVAHHATHERNFMQYYSTKVFKTPFKHRIVDTSFLYKIINPQFQNISLESLCEYNKIPIIDRHNALSDAKMTAKIWSIYMNKAIEIGCETLEDVYTHFAKI
ncbi:DNA polymerase-3 subunit epsilon [Ureibacillus xyleni]|uniref:DNA polymerase-3 subunit epsilon n=1 Tax=Ureibacillus xyleni TaxID=614648 RepID=A0A285SH93_9BACL|nr:exonuclease domain-containing protein [Ureibacillus xyleni]SOC05338.1 DNA polymerase-3 subunit epsilon [Ureibacillus xyleni]